MTVMITAMARPHFHQWSFLMIMMTITPFPVLTCGDYYDNDYDYYDNDGDDYDDENECDPIKGN